MVIFLLSLVLSEEQMSFDMVRLFSLVLSEEKMSDDGRLTIDWGIVLLGG